MPPKVQKGSNTMHTIFSNTHHPFSVKTFGKKLLLSFCIGCLFSSLLLHPHHTKAAVYKKGFTYRKLTPAIKKKITGVSYRKNPYITYNDLRYIRVLYYDFHGDIQSGELIVNKKIVKKVVKIFYQLYKMKYPIERIQLIDAYHADDLKSMAANNTSAFNYRPVAGTNRLSNHSYGLAIDINPRINPYINSHKKLTPTNGAVYQCRDPKKCKGKYARYMIQKNSKITKIFKKYGFSWGGDWVYSKDYQHFEYTIVNVYFVKH